jgi:hypothetical protein
MSHDEEKSLPEELADRATKLGDVWGWKYQDIPEVVKNCRKLDLAIFAGSFILIFPDGLFDIYWLGAYPKPRMTGEHWAQYVQRSCSEFLDSFNEMIAKLDFEKEILGEYLKEHPESAADAINHLYFELDIRSEDNYLDSEANYSR